MFFAIFINIMDKLTLTELNEKAVKLAADKKTPRVCTLLIQELIRRLNQGSAPGVLQSLFSVFRRAPVELPIVKPQSRVCPECKGNSTVQYINKNKMCKTCYLKTTKVKCKLCPNKIEKTKETGTCGSCDIKTGKRKTISKALRIKVWDNHFGEKAREGKCCLCENTIKIECFDAGHIISHANGGETIASNLVPMCSVCNKSMGAENLDIAKAKFRKS
jgi:hypothetical protein